MKDLTNTELVAKYKAIGAEFNAVAAELRNRNLGWKYLVDNGMKIQAIRAYSDEKKVSLSEARKFIDNYLVDSIVDAVVKHGIKIDDILDEKE